MMFLEIPAEGREVSTLIRHGTELNSKGQMSNKRQLNDTGQLANEGQLVKEKQ